MMRLPPNLDSPQLLAFDRVAREGGFSRAATTLGVGQPAVSARIATLEAAVGGPLFVRGRKVKLTPLGETLLPYARRALDVLTEGVESARLVQAGQRGRVTLGTLGSLAGGLVTPALLAFSAKHPNVECLVKAGDHEHVLSLLWDGLVELGLVAWPFSRAGAAELKPWFVFSESVPLVAHPRHPLASCKRVSRVELLELGRPLYRLRWWPEHHPLLDELARAAGPVLELPMETARALVIAGHGVGFFTRTFIAEDLAEGRLVTVDVRDMPRITRGSALVRRRTGPLSAAHEAFVTSLASEARTLAARERATSRRRAPASARSP
jgi:LysR family transcriptional regulator, low CO2-responsive transcriptional regulator